MIVDARRHNPDPAYLRNLIKQAGLTQEEAARLIGIAARTMRCYLSPADVETHLSAPYVVQVALECLSAPAKP